MPRLLSPAGSVEALHAAVDAGADEVYLGGGDLNARIGAKNFDNDALIHAGEYCRRHGVGLCITLNTLLSDREMESALEFAAFLQEKVRPYAYIVQDVGLAAELKKKYPNINLHASTQMAFHNEYGAEICRRMGFSRMVIAREATRKDIMSVVSTGIETEVFVHGAICVSQSGGCLMSSFIGKRSGNRGRCAQPCRLPYSGKMRYPLSLKDMCLAEHITELTEMGVTALKIEGRMKSPDYVYTVTSVYRRLLDENRNATKDEMRILQSAFSRDGFTDGFFTGKIDAKMFGARDNGEKNSFLPRIKPCHTAHTDVSRETFFDPPLRDDSKTIPAKQQRGAVLRFADGADGFEECCKAAVRVDIPIWRLVRLPCEPDKISAVLPRTVFAEDLDHVKELIDHAYKLGVRQMTVCNISQLPLAKGFFVHADLSANVTNSYTAAFLSDMSLSSACISPEIMPKSMKFLPMAYEYPVYGRLPLMHTATCIIKNLGGVCGNGTCKGILTDRTGAKFLILREYGHRNIIYNSVPLNLTDKCRMLRKEGIGLYTVIITDETPSEILRVLESIASTVPPTGSYTRGYWK